MNLYQIVAQKLKDNNKSWDDVEFILSSRDDYEEEFNIPLKDFCQIAKTIDVSSMSDNIKVVGQDFWLDSKDADVGYFNFIQMPKRAKITMDEINLTKIILNNPDTTDKATLLGLLYEED